MTDAFSLGTFLPYRLAVLAERISRRLAVEYGASHGLSVAEWRVLVHLRGSGPVSVRDIHDRVALDKPRVSRAVARLGASGLVAKSAARGDARLVEISLTDQGEAVLRALVPVVCEVEKSLLDGLDAAELAGFLAVMERLHARLDQDPKARPRPDTPP